MHSIWKDAVFRLGVFLFAVLWGCCGTLWAWSPGTGSPTAVQDFTVTTTDRFDVLSFYNCVYNASESYASDIAWSGSVAAHVSGTTSSVFKDDVRRRINFYRAMAGMPADIVFDSTYSSNDQDAALMFAVNYQLSHNPDPSWNYFVTTGSTGASHSDIALASGGGVADVVYGPPAIDGYMVDPPNTLNDPTYNHEVGHRRWLLYSQQQTMGTGDIPPSTVTIISGTTETTYQNVTANAVWILGTFKPTPLLKAVPWPNAGYIPLPLMPARWSISYPAADFSAASVKMNGVSMPIVSNTDGGRGDNTLVWEPTGLPSALTSDTTYTVAVSGVTISGTQTNFNYNVTLFDPNVLGSTVTISGTNAPFVTGENYTFNAIPSADSYQLRVSTQDSVQWTEGAEDTPTPQITAATTGTYSLRQSVVKRTGAKAFQLAFPNLSDISDQSFVITRDVIPGANSQLQFYYLRRFITSTVLLRAQVSTDNGLTWTSLWTSTGVDILSPGDWESFPAVNPNGNVSLGTYAGQLIKIRFLMHADDDTQGYVVYDPTDPTDSFAYYGFFIDDITVTNAVELVNTTTTTLATSATSFALNSTTVGGALTANTTYCLRVRPSVGLRWYGDGPLLYVTAQALMKYSDWITKLYPSVTGGVSGDYNHDGISNGLEFAFGLNPTVPHRPSALPRPTITSGTLGVSFSQPDGVTGVTYGAEWSTNLTSWTAITDSGTSPVHTFSISTVGVPKAFFRYKITLQQ